ncbi:hypothetical protein M3Y99_01016400 [Aphelenchoides fujianensis]|nr:hypothetical protein M3Y99_01016400 [Aphelenchoides fujianensis]
MERQCSCFLVFAASLQFLVYGATLLAMFQAFHEGLVVRAFDMDEVGFYALFIIFFQMFSIVFGGHALVSFFEMAWKGSFGYGELNATRCKAMVAGSFGFGFSGLSAVCFHFQPQLFTFHGLYCLLDGVTCLLLCVVFIRRAMLIKEFVHELIQTNSLNWIPLSERNARDLYKLQDSESEMRAYINASRFGCFRRHAHAFRHAEFYQLQKWIAQIERFLSSNEPKEAIAVLAREMGERAKVFKINAEDQERYRELAMLPTSSKLELMEFEDEV